MNEIKQIFMELIRRLKMDWDAGRSIPVPVRENENWQSRNSKMR